MLTLATELLGSLPILGIILGNVLTFTDYLSDPNRVLHWTNSWANFPSGVFTAIFVPDSPVLLGKVSWDYWFILTVGILIAWYVLFSLTNIYLEARQRALRFGFCVGMVFVIAFLGDFAALFYYPQTAGPSGAIYALIGLTYGFGISNTVLLFKAGRASLKLHLR